MIVDDDDFLLHVDVEHRGNQPFDRGDFVVGRDHDREQNLGVDLLS